MGMHKRDIVLGLDKLFLFYAYFYSYILKIFTYYSFRRPVILLKTPIISFQKDTCTVKQSQSLMIIVL